MILNGKQLDKIIYADSYCFNNHFIQNLLLVE